MALILKDRVQETSTTTGTGTLTLAGAVTQFQTFSSAIGNGNTTYYTIYNAGASDWEIGIGTVGAGTLARTTVLASSNAGSLVNFTGTLYVFGDYPAGKSVYLDASGNVSDLGNVDLGAHYLVNASHIGVNTTTVPDILVRAVGDNNATSRIAVRGYSSDANSSSVRVTKFRGNAGAPQAPQSGDSLGKFELAGYGTTSSSGYAQASFEGVATENWGATARGSKTLVKVTPNTTTTQVTALTIDQDKSATFASSVTATSFSGSGSGLTGVVTSVTGTAPVASSGGATPAISMAAANTSTNGYLTSTDWNTFNGKGSGTVTSVAASVPSVLSISGSPITTSGTLAITYSGTALPAANGGTGLTSPSTAGNVLTSNGSAWVSSAPASGGLSWQSVKTSNFTAVSGNGYPINTTSNAITITLPSSPSAGNYVVLTDYAGTFATNNLTINPNSVNLDGNSSNGIVRISRSTTSLVYIDSTQGWITFSNVTPIQSYSISYLAIAGGGGGGSAGGGGGSGGLLSGTSTLSSGTTYSITVGAGGAGGGPGSNRGGSGTGTVGAAGSNSVFNSLTSIGGGAGASEAGAGTSGGSGGGGSHSGSPSGYSGTSGQGYAGGTAASSGLPNAGGGGGGGASAVGNDAVTSVAGNGGNGTASSITGSSVTYAGGGGGGVRGTGTVGTGGSGGGANGASSATPADSATANTGGGGGGGGHLNGANNQGAGGNGGSGIVILSIPTVNYTGTTSGSPTITTSGSNTILQFTSSGSYTA